MSEDPVENEWINAMALPYKWVELEEICVLLSKTLELTFEMEPSKFLMAVAGVETSFAADNIPRFEPAYAPGGRYYDLNAPLIEAHAKFGDSISYSWGPWQIMYEVARELGYRGAPEALRFAETSGPWVVQKLNRISRNGANSVERILGAWNTGSWRTGTQPIYYIQRFWACYTKINPIII